MSGEHTAVGDELVTRAAPSAPRPTGATVGVSRSDDPGRLVGIGIKQPIAPPATQPSEQEQAATHNYNLTKLDIPAERAPYIDEVMTHLHAEGGDQAHAELGARVALRIQEAQDKADRGLVALTAREMRNQLGDEEFNRAWSGIQNYAKGLPPEIQNDFLWMAARSENGFRTARNWSEQPPYDPAMPQLPAAQRTEAAAPSAPIGSREYWRQLREAEALQSRDDRLGRVSGVDTRGFSPSR